MGILQATNPTDSRGITTKIESARGCGYRKKGGLYLVSDGIGLPCGRLPIPLTVCPCCNTGIKPSRGFTWISSALFEGLPCRSNKDSNVCYGCPFNGRVSRMGLLWVGSKFYNSPAEFIKEGRNVGISKRIAQIPKELVLGETWVALAHRGAITKLFPLRTVRGNGVSLIEM